MLFVKNKEEEEEKNLYFRIQHLAITHFYCCQFFILQFLSNKFNLINRVFREIDSHATIMVIH